MSEVRLSERADGDLLKIYLDGIELFGRRQALRYIEELEGVFTLISGTPRMGRDAPALGERVRRHEHRAHIILYRIEPDGILILAVVGGRNLNDLNA